MVFFNLKEIKTEDQAIDAASELSDLAIQASCATRGRGQKLRMVNSKLEMLRKKCLKEQWKLPLQVLMDTFMLLEEERANMIANAFNI